MELLVVAEAAGSLMMMTRGEVVGVADEAVATVGHGTLEAAAGVIG